MGSLGQGTWPERQPILIQEVLITDSDLFQPRLASGIYTVLSLFTTSGCQVTHLMLRVKSK